MSFYREVDGPITRHYELDETDGSEIINSVTHRTPRARIDAVETQAFGLSIFLDGQLQFTEQDEYIYHEMLVHPAMAAATSRQRVCILGGGDGLALREVLRWPEVEHVDLIDWDPFFVDFCSMELDELTNSSLYDSRVHYDSSDIRDRFQDTRRYNTIFIDLLDPNDTSGECVNLWQDMLQTARRWLAPGGCIALNAGGVLPWDFKTAEWIWQMIQNTFRGFDGYCVQAYKVFVPSFAKEWCFFLICPSQRLQSIQDLRINMMENLRFFDRRTWRASCLWSREFRRALPTDAVNLSQGQLNR